MNQAGIPAEKDAQRGLDHGAWVPLYHMLPDANIPVFQVSLPATFNAATALALGKALAPLREQGVLILASGSMTHNLYEFRQRGSHAEPYVHAFADWVREHVKANDVDLLLNYRALAPEAQRAHPTPDHFLPLFVAIGAQSEDEPLQVLGDEVTYACCPWSRMCGAASVKSIDGQEKQRGGNDHCPHAASAQKVAHAISTSRQVYS